MTQTPSSGWPDPNTNPDLAGDFKMFLWAVWKERGWEPSDIQYRAADFLQSEGSSRKIFSAMRGFGKTELTAAFACWLGYRDPDICILIMSATAEVSGDILGLMRSLIDSCSFLKHMAPKGRKTKDRDGAFRFDFGHKQNFRKDSSVVARGIRSQITGLHPDVVISDDVETPENGMTSGGRDQTRAKFGEYEDVLNPGGMVVTLGTPQTEDSTYFYLAELDYDMIRIPAEYPDPNNEVSMRNLAPFLVEAMERGDPGTEPGQPTNPHRMDGPYLLAKKARQGRHRYALQMLLDPGLANADQYPLRLSDFIVFDCAIDIAPATIVWGTSDPREDIQAPSVISADKFFSPIFHSDDWKPYQRAVMFVDPSGKGKDETAAAVAKRCGGHIYVCDVFGTTGSHDDRTMLQLVEMAKKWEVDEVIVESNAGGEIYANLLQMKIAQVLGRPIKVTPQASGNKQKELRIIDTLEPLMNQHRIAIDPRIARDTVFLYQLCRITRDRGCLDHDDRIDAFAGAVAQLADVASVDVDKQIETEYIRSVTRAAEEFEKSYRKSGLVRGSITGFRELPSSAQRLSKRSRGWGRR